ncbi:helix-turn-helix domain-containing protein [Tsuneonella mangrovi]|uniref:helix-turn-helix domain-containing protein n=1 Tax=Tsuneonella mangrovi TaxID=1982042 RepID=UPI001471A177|nr:AraC family transcriptional regulator [Tsuneonella mangrovi]
MPEALAPFITTFYLFRCEERDIRDVQPAAVGQLMLFLHGQGTMTFHDGNSDPSTRQNLLTPQSRAATVEVTGPLHVFGVVLSPLGWGAISGLDAGKWGNRLLDAVEVLGDGIATLGEAVRAAYRANPETDGSDLVALAAPFLLERVQPLDPGHMRLLRNVALWLGESLNPPVEALYERCTYSRRQVQRLVSRYFGSTPRQLARQYRALRVVALLNQPGITDSQVAGLLENFYDQSHMIREIREFVGRTPARLNSGDAPILESLIDVRNFREIEPKVAPLPKDWDKVEKGDNGD